MTNWNLFGKVTVTFYSHNQQFLIAAAKTSAKLRELLELYSLKVSCVITMPLLKRAVSL